MRTPYPDLDWSLVNALGIDIGGTKIAGALVDADGAILASSTRPTTASRPEGILEAVVDVVAELDPHARAGTVGVAVAAFLDRERTTVFFSPNISWVNYPLHQALTEALGRVVLIENDANAAGWAEFRFGAGRGARSMMMLTMGTGVGGALVDEGRLIIGGFGSAGELGHIVIDPGGRPCGCGNRGCLEQYASGTALMRVAREYLEDPGLTPDALAQALQNDHPRAMEALIEACDAMGRGIASLVSVTDPDVVVIGGGVAKAGPILATLIQQRFESHYPAAGKRPVATIEVASLGNTAGVIGAADLARRAIAAGP